MLLLQWWEYPEPIISVRKGQKTDTDTSNMGSQETGYDIPSAFEGKTILLTGANGFFGQAVSKQFYHVRLHHFLCRDLTTAVHCNSSSNDFYPDLFAQPGFTA